MHSSQLPLQHNSVIMKPGPSSWISLFCQKVKRKSEQKMKDYSQLMAELKKIAHVLARKLERKKHSVKKDQIWSGLTCMPKCGCHVWQCQMS